MLLRTPLQVPGKWPPLKCYIIYLRWLIIRATKWNRGLFTDLLAFSLWLRKFEAVQSFITSNGIPYLQMTLIVLHSTSRREKERMRKFPIADVQFETPLHWSNFQCVSLLTIGLGDRLVHFPLKIFLSGSGLEQGSFSFIRIIG